MIEIKVEPYCHECTEFEAETEESIITADGRLVGVRHTITCEHAQKCRYIKRFLEEKVCK